MTHHTLGTLIRDAILLAAAALSFYFLQDRLVQHGFTSIDNLKDTIAWAVIGLVSLVIVFSLVFVVEALFIVPFRLWRDARSVQANIQSTYKPRIVWRPSSLRERLKYPTPPARAYYGRNVINTFGQSVNARGGEAELKKDFDFGDLSRTRVGRIELDCRITARFPVKPLRVYVLPWTSEPPMFGEIDGSNPHDLPPLTRNETIKVTIKANLANRRNADPHFEWGLTLTECAHRLTKFSIIIEFEEGRLEHVYEPQYVIGVLSSLAASMHRLYYDETAQTLKRPRDPV